MDYKKVAAALVDQYNVCQYGQELFIISIEDALRAAAADMNEEIALYFDNVTKEAHEEIESLEHSKMEWPDIQYYLGECYGQTGYGDTVRKMLKEK